MRALVVLILLFGTKVYGYSCFTNEASGINGKWMKRFLVYHESVPEAVTFSICSVESADQLNASTLTTTLASPNCRPLFPRPLTLEFYQQNFSTIRSAEIKHYASIFSRKFKSELNDKSDQELLEMISQKAIRKELEQMTPEGSFQNYLNLARSNQVGDTICKPSEDPSLRIFQSMLK